MIAAVAEMFFTQIKRSQWLRRETGHFVINTILNALHVVDTPYMNVWLFITLEFYNLCTMRSRLCHSQSNDELSDGEKNKRFYSSYTRQYPLARRPTWCDSGGGGGGVAVWKWQQRKKSYVGDGAMNQRKLNLLLCKCEANGNEIDDGDAWTARCRTLFFGASCVSCGHMPMERHRSGAKYECKWYEWMKKRN